MWVAQLPAFCDINRVAFQAPRNSSPYLVQVPEDLGAAPPPLPPCPVDTDMVLTMSLSLCGT